MKKIDDLARQFGDPIVVPRERNMYNNPGQSYSILDDPGYIIMHEIACPGPADCINKIFNHLFGNYSFVCPYVISSCFLSGEIAHNTLDYQNIGQK
jgi:hypothetical protein